MAYTPTVWKNGEFPPIDAEHLNKIEQGIANSAPGGFGLGTRSKWLTNADDLNNIYQGGFYFWYGNNIPANAPAGINYGGMIVMSRSATEFVQQVFNITDISNLQNCMLVRTAYNNTWYPWEWVNPPMELGIEYRTTERFLGKPVYVKAFNVSSLPNNSSLSVNIGTNSDGSADETIRAITGYGVTANGSTIPAFAWSRDPSKKIYLQLYLWIAFLDTTFDASSESATIVVKYTKTTD